MNIQLQNLVSVSDVSRAASATIAKAQAGEIQVILNHNKPVAAIVGIAVLERLRQLEQDLENRSLVATAEQRMIDDDGSRHDLYEVAAKHGIKLAKPKP